MKKVSKVAFAFVAPLVLICNPAKSEPVLIDGPVQLRVFSHLGAGHQPSIDLSATGDIYVGLITPSFHMTGNSSITAGIDVSIYAEGITLGSINAFGVITVVSGDANSAGINANLITAPTNLTLSRLDLKIDPALVILSLSLTAAGVSVISAAGGVTLTSDSLVDYTLSPGVGGSVTVSAGVSVVSGETNTSGGEITPAGQAAAPAVVSPQSAPAVPLNLFWPHPPAPIMTLGDENPIEVTGDVLLVTDLQIHNSVFNAGGSFFAQQIPEPTSSLLIASGWLLIASYRAKGNQHDA